MKFSKRQVLNVTELVTLQVRRNLGIGTEGPASCLNHLAFRSRFETRYI